jgi:gamma-glutamyltranspeptidase/glutathione hydrolase
MRAARLAIALTPAVLFQAGAAQPVRARSAMVVTREPHATEVGLATLKAGGNAVDAAIAIGFALAVTHPSAGNIGGGGFMLVRFADGRTTFIDFRERAPGKATRDMYLTGDGKLTDASIKGWLAPGVPGTPRGFEYAHRKYGGRPWAELVAPAVRLAREGFLVSHGLASSLKNSDRLSAFPESKRIFQNRGKFFEPGDRLVQTDLAAVLDRIARAGARDFYEGETARRIADAMAANGGIITLEDLTDYAAVEREPIKGRYRGYDVISAPPPSSGGIGILLMLGVLEGTGYDKSGAESAAAIHFVAEAMRRFYADRSEHLADPDFHRVPLRQLLSPEYLRKLRSSIDRDRVTPSEGVHPMVPEHTETTHYSVVDKDGNAVAVTYTLNGGYGSGVTVPGTGVLLNNEMDDFSAKPGHPNMFGLVQGMANVIQPGKRPLSSMTPTILLRDGKPFMVVGTPGGSRIISNVLQVILNVVDFGMNVQDAVNFPRFHHQWRPDKLHLENGISPDTAALLQARGHAIERVSSMCEMAAIVIDRGWLQGAADPRVEGNALGY